MLISNFHINSKEKVYCVQRPMQAAVCTQIGECERLAFVGCCSQPLNCIQSFALLKYTSHTP
jgi:hypothetical protein